MAALVKACFEIRKGGQMEKLILIIFFVLIPLNVGGAEEGRNPDVMELKNQRNEYEYICPVCQKKSGFLVRPKKLHGSDVDVFHREVKSLNDWTQEAHFDLDEKKLCSFCSPDIDLGERSVDLLVQYPDGEVFIYKGVTYEDLRLLSDFFTEYMFNFEVSPELFKERMGRIIKMLGGDKLTKGIQLYSDGRMRKEKMVHSGIVFGKE